MGLAGVDKEDTVARCPVADQKREGKRLGNLFNEARQDQDRSGERLDDLFERASEDAKQDKDKKPFNPFDLE